MKSHPGSHNGAGTGQVSSSCTVQVHSLRPQHSQGEPRLSGLCSTRVTYTPCKMHSKQSRRKGKKQSAMEFLHPCLNQLGYVMGGEISLCNCWHDEICGIIDKKKTLGFCFNKVEEWPAVGEPHSVQLFSYLGKRSLCSIQLKFFTQASANMAGVASPELFQTLPPNLLTLFSRAQAFDDLNERSNPANPDFSFVLWQE